MKNDYKWLYISWALGAISISIAIAVAIWITKSAWCLWAFLFLPNVKRSEKEDDAND